MGQVRRTDSIAPVVRASTTTLTMASTVGGLATRITVGGQQYKLTSTITLSTGTTGFNGIDTGSFTAGTVYNIFAVVSAGSLGMVISTATAPTGFNSYKFLGKLIAATGATISHVMNVNEPFIEYLYNSSTSTNSSDTSLFAWGIAGAQIQAITTSIGRRVRSLVAQVANDKMDIEISADQTKWEPLIGFSTPANSGAAQIAPYVIQNANSYGLGQLSFVNANDSDVYWGIYAYPNGTTYGATGTAWSTNAGNYFWRVKKVSGPVLVP